MRHFTHSEPFEHPNYEDDPTTTEFAFYYFQKLLIHSYDLPITTMSCPSRDRFPPTGCLRIDLSQVVIDGYHVISTSKWLPTPSDSFQSCTNPAARSRFDLLDAQQPPRLSKHWVCIPRRRTSGECQGVSRGPDKRLKRGECKHNSEGNMGPEVQ